MSDALEVGSALGFVFGGEGVAPVVAKGFGLEERGIVGFGVDGFVLIRFGVPAREGREQTHRARLEPGGEFSDGSGELLGPGRILPLVTVHSGKRNVVVHAVAFGALLHGFSHWMS